MHILLKYVILTGIVVLVGVLLQTHSRTRVREFFEDLSYNTMEEKLVDLYEAVLQRQPNSQELIENTRDIKSGTLTFKGLRQRLLDSEEHARAMKLQSNALTPELDKVLSDKELFKTIQAAYKLEKKKDLPSNMLLQYRDIYIYLDYNEYTFRAFLQHKKYKTFEEDISRVSNMDKETLLAKFKENFDKKELVAAGIKIREADEAAAAASPAGGSGAPAPASPTDRLARTVDSTDPSVSATLIRILSGTSGGRLDIDAQARILDEIDKIQNNPNLTPEEKRQAIAAILALANEDAVSKASAEAIMAQHEGADYIDAPTHQGDMVLRPEFAWSVPQKRPPVCNMLGQKPNVQPLMANSKLLLGTSLEEAKDTQVGTMMPKFKYQEYATVPVPKPKCAPAVPVAPAAPVAPAVKASA